MDCDGYSWSRGCSRFNEPPCPLRYRPLSYIRKRIPCIMHFGAQVVTTIGPNLNSDGHAHPCPGCACTHLFSHGQIYCFGLKPPQIALEYSKFGIFCLKLTLKLFFFDLACFSLHFSQLFWAQHSKHNFRVDPRSFCLNLSWIIFGYSCQTHPFLSEVANTRQR